MAKRDKLPKEPIVFLSSTFRDLEAHRAVLKLALESSGYRVFGMELFTAANLPTLDTCIAELTRSHIYVGVIGEYFGSSPPGFKKSYTQLEYLEAIKRKMPIFLFMTASDAEITPAQIEHDAQKLQRLGEFRTRLQTKHSVSFFKTAHQAAWQILAALRKHELRLSEKKAPK
jgi:hypothetical protein